jgi:hypothetical protein
MFGKSKITLQNEIKYLEKKIKRLERDLEIERSVLKGYDELYREKSVNQMLERSAREEPVMIDFDKVNVWSIERNHIDGKNITVVGVLEEYSSDGAILTKSNDYRYNTNSDGHKRIIAAYEAHRAKKEKQS